MKKHINHHPIKRIVAMLLAIISAVGIFTIKQPIEADAASVSKSVSSVSISTKSDNYYIITKNNAAVRNGTSSRSQLYCKLKKDTLIYATGSTKNHLMIEMAGKTYYISKSYCKDANNTYSASIAYAPSACALRSGPYETASKVTLGKKEAVRVIGSLTNKYGSCWTVVFYSGNKIGYVYSRNLKTADKVKLEIYGNTSNIMVGDTTQLSYKVSPDLNVKWSSSNASIAKVNSSGKVTGVSGGTCKIRATVNGILTAEYKITVETYESQIKSTYTAIKKMTRRNSFNGYCGLYVGSTLQARGITTRMSSYNGKDFYDAYKNMKTTSGGYAVKTYPDTAYSLKGALNAITNNGKTNVKNLMVCFHTGSGEAGRRYGHVVFIHAIVDGKVYFSESFSARVAGKTYAEGAPIVCTINQFASYYNSWCTFEGIVHFTK